jgi:hypothetical protein
MPGRYTLENRNYIGMEYDVGIFEAAKKRLGDVAVSKAQK